MSISQSHRSPAIDSFGGLYENLAAAWESHQRLRSQLPEIAELAVSSARLDEARADMWAWSKQNRIDGR